MEGISGTRLKATSGVCEEIKRGAKFLGLIYV
jgi:hypothetical protein